MYLHDEKVSLKDRVYDISPKKGYGEVIKISKSEITVKFYNNNRYYSYNSNGKCSDQLECSLYWNKPLIIKPKKDENDWFKKQQIVNQILNLIENFNKKDN